MPANSLLLKIWLLIWPPTAATFPLAPPLLWYLFAVPKTCQTCTYLTESLHLHFSIVRMLFSWIHAGLLISYLSCLLKYILWSAGIKMQSSPSTKHVLSPLYTLLYFFLAFPVYCVFTYYLLSLPVLSIGTGTFFSLQNC